MIDFKTGRHRRGALTREITYQRVLLAVYMLTDDDGLSCEATIARIAQECGHGIDAVRRSIKLMVDRGVVGTVDQWDGLNRRVLVLLDHPGARGFIAGIKSRIAAEVCAELDRRVARKLGGV